MQTIEIRDRTDRFGRRLLTIDDTAARDLRVWIRDNWTEIPDVADGYSATVGPSHRLYPLLDALHLASQEGDNRHPFIAGHSFGDEQAEGEQPSSYDTLVSTFGVTRVAERGYRF